MLFGGASQFQSSSRVPVTARTASNPSFSLVVVVAVVVVVIIVVAQSPATRRHASRDGVGPDVVPAYP